MMDNEFLKIKQYTDYGCNYFYAERKGRDSIAFILRDGELFGLINEFKPPVGKFLITAFGGSLDKDKTIEEIVHEEVQEEAGYQDAKIEHQGMCFVSTQMNQFCHLFMVDVTDAIKCDRTFISPMDEKTNVVWQTQQQILSPFGFCWKATTILTRWRERHEPNNAN